MAKGKPGQLGSGSPMTKTMGQGAPRQTQAGPNKPPMQKGAVPGAAVKKTSTKKGK